MLRFLHGRTPLSYQKPVGAVSADSVRNRVIQEYEISLWLPKNMQAAYLDGNKAFTKRTNSHLAR